MQKSYEKVSVFPCFVFMAGFSSYTVDRISVADVDMYANGLNCVSAFIVPPKSTLRHPNFSKFPFSFSYSALAMATLVSFPLSYKGSVVYNSGHQSGLQIGRL